MQTWKKNIISYAISYWRMTLKEKELKKRLTYIFILLPVLNFFNQSNFLWDQSFLFGFLLVFFEMIKNLKKCYQKKDSKIVNTTAKTDPSTEYKSECSEKNSQYLVKCCLYFGAESCKLKLVRIGWKTVGFSSSADLSPDENFPAKVRFQNIWHCVRDTVPKQETPPFSSGQN